MKFNKFSVLFIFMVPLIFTIAKAQPEFEVDEIADGVFLHYGKHEQINAENSGDISNIGFILGEEYVAVIDTGGSRKVGEQLKREISKVTDLPIRYVILTHAHPDHVFGVKAFESAEIEVVGHKNLTDSLIQRGKFYRDRFINEGLSGDDLMLLPQTVFVNGSIRLDLGNRQLLLVATETSHTNNDLLVIDEATKTIWTGDLVFRERIPVIDGDVIGWLETMDMLLQYSANLIVPGHGHIAVNWPEALQDQRRYLQKLVVQARELLLENGTIQDAVREVGMDEAQHWVLFSDHHGQNVSRVYTQLEWE